MSEHLIIKPTGYYIQVKVKYLLWNKSDNDYNNIDYAFPVDYYDNYDDIEIDNEYLSALYYKVGWLDNYVKNVCFWDNGQMVPYQVGNSPKVKKGFQIKVHVDEGETNLTPNVSRKWYYIQFSIPKHSFKTIEVQYEVACIETEEPRVVNPYSTLTYDTPPYSIDGYLSMLSPSIGCGFTYDFSPAYTWGSGKVGDLFVEIDMTEMRNIYYAGNLFFFIKEQYPFVKTAKGYSCLLRDFEFKDKPALRIQFWPNKDRYQVELGGVEQLTQNMVPYSEYTITASKVDAAYPTSNLSDMNPSTAFILKNNGAKDTIVIKFKKPTIVTAVLLMGGYYKSEKTFNENSRLRVALLSSSTETYAFGFGDGYESKYPSATMPFWSQLLSDMLVCPTNFKIYVVDNDKWKVIPVTELKISPLEVVKGTKYDDLCISELFVIGDRY